MTIKDGYNLFNNIPTPTQEPPATAQEPAVIAPEALETPEATPAPAEPPKAAGNVRNGYTMYAGTRGAAYLAAHTN
ncbi:hypothetical protein [Pseudarthrobacter siccitolerans]